MAADFLPGLEIQFASHRSLLPVILMPRKILSRKMARRNETMFTDTHALLPCGGTGEIIAI